MLCNPPPTAENTPQADPCFITVAAAADMLGVSVKTVYKLFHDKQLRGIKVGSAVRIDRQSVLDYIRCHENMPPAGEAPEPATESEGPAEAPPPYEPPAT